jgi:hypothetical protein
MGHQEGWRGGGVRGAGGDTCPGRCTTDRVALEAVVVVVVVGDGKQG